MRHRKMKAAPEPFRKAIAPSRADLVVAGECLLTWYWLADLCAQAPMPLVLGHVLSMKALHGGKAKHDQIDAQKIAVLRRGGMLPQASVYPAAMRATRDLRRRRLPLTRQRAALRAQVQNTNRQDNLPEIGQQLASKATRNGVAARCPEPAVQKRVDVDLALMDSSDHRRSAVEWTIVHTAKQPHAPTLYRRQFVPGIGKILRVVLLDEIHDIRRFPRVQACVAYGRLVNWATASAGTRDGTSGAKLGNADLTWAFAEAAVLCLRHHPAGQHDLARLENHHGKGQAVTVFAHQVARAVSDLRTRDPAFDRQPFLTGSWSGAGEPTASRDEHGLSLACGARMIARRQGTRRST